MTELHMAKLIIVVGLPGSGKSAFLDPLRPSLPGLCIHDFMKDSRGGAHFTHSQHYSALIEHLRAGRDCAIADREYCDTWTRIEIEQVVRVDIANIEIEWVFFAKDVEACQANI